MRTASLLLLGGLCVIGAGCASTAPPPAPAAAPPVRPPVRDATDEERATITRLLVPMLITSGIWTAPADGCAAAFGVLPVETINLAVGPHPRCKFSLLITEGALNTLPPDELRAGLAHEIGHVQLGHFAARRERRAKEKKAREEINDKAAVGAAVSAIPIIGPILGIGVAGTQMVTEASVAGEYRGYDREEELAADRFGVDLLQLVVGRVRACQAEVALLDRLTRARGERPWSAWINTHPLPADRLKDVKEMCPN